MPFKPVELPKCPKCEKSVYAAEEKLAGGHKWHKACFKCSMCNKMLDSTSCAEHDGALYCKVCHGRKFGPKGYGFGGGAGALNTDTGEKFGNTEFQTNGHNSPSSGIAAPEGQGCPRCSCFVYHADQIFSKNQVWHKQCFKCRTCHKQLDSRSACDGPDSDVYCTECVRAFDLGLDCNHCKGQCWRSGNNCQIEDILQEKAKLKIKYKKKTLIPPPVVKVKGSISMESADKGTGALFIILDAIKRQKLQRLEEERKKKSENNFDNGIMNGRQLLKPLPKVEADR